MKKIIAASAVMFAVALGNVAIAFCDKLEDVDACKAQVDQALKYAEFKLEQAEEAAKKQAVTGMTSDIAKAYKLVKLEDYIKDVERIRTQSYGGCWGK